MARSKKKMLICLVAMLCCAVHVQASLVAYYSFDDAANLTVDNSGNGNNLSNYDNSMPVGVIGQVGGAADFNGTTDSLDTKVGDTSPSIYPDGSFTVSLWAKPDVANAGMYVTFPTARKGGFGIITDGGSPTWRAYTYGMSESGAALYGGSINSGVVIEADRYDHITFVYEALGSDGGTMGNYTGTGTLFINGTETYSIENMVYGPSEFRFGLGGRVASASHFDGSIDEFAVFNHVLSAGEIAGLADGTYTPMTVPEPATLSMLLGMAVLAGRIRKK